MELQLCHLVEQQIITVHCNIDIYLSHSRLTPEGMLKVLFDDSPTIFDRPAFLGNFYNLIDKSK